MPRPQFSLKALLWFTFVVAAFCQCLRPALPEIKRFVEIEVYGPDFSTPTDPELAETLRAHFAKQRQ